MKANTLHDMRTFFLLAFMALCAFPARCQTQPTALRNPPPECRPPASECGYPKGDVVQNGCEKLGADAGEGAPSSGSASCWVVLRMTDAD